MRATFERLGPTLLYERVFARPTMLGRISAKVRRFYGDLTSDIQLAPELAQHGPFDVLYVNSVGSAWMLRRLRHLAPLCITHVHEMPDLIRALGPNNWNAAQNMSDAFFASSDSVAHGLIAELGVEPRSIDVFNPYPQNVLPASEVASARHWIRARLKLPATAHLVGMCGYASLVKGTDLLPQVAVKVPTLINDREVHFVHIGNVEQGPLTRFLRRDVEKCGLAARVHLAGEQEDPMQWLAALDVNLLLSREESFGMVVLEAAAHSVPTICFDGIGQASVFCSGGSGRVVPYLDVDAIAASLTELLSLDVLRAALGHTAYLKVNEGFTAEAIMPRWLARLDALANRFPTM